MSIRVKLVLHERSNIYIYLTLGYSTIYVTDLYQMIRPLGVIFLKGIAPKIRTKGVHFVHDNMHECANKI